MRVRPLANFSRAVHGAPSLVQRFRVPKEPSDLKAWPRAALSGHQFGGDASVATFVSRARAAKTLRIAPLFVSEGATSLREGVAISVLPDWLVGDDLETGKLVRLLARWSARAIPLNLVYPADRRRPSPRSGLPRVCGKDAGSAHLSIQPI